MTVLNQTPSAFRQLIAADAAGRHGGGAGAALRGLRRARRWSRRACASGWRGTGTERPRLVNMYGITETTVHVTYRPLSRADVEGGSASVIGGPIPDLRAYVLDGAAEPVAAWACRASCTSAARAWRAATWAGRS